MQGIQKGVELFLGNLVTARCRVRLARTGDGVIGRRRAYGFGVGRPGPVRFDQALQALQQIWIGGFHGLAGMQRIHHRVDFVQRLQDRIHQIRR